MVRITKELAPASSQLHPLRVDPAQHVEKIRHKAGDAALEQRGISRHHRLLRHRHPVGWARHCNEEGGDGKGLIDAGWQGL